MVGCLLLVLVAVCGRAERWWLMQFLEALVASHGHRYGQLDGLPPGPERKVRFGVLFTRDQLAAVDAYLATGPPPGRAAREAVEGHRAAKAGELELYERLEAEKRFELTEAEERREAELLAEGDRLLHVIGRMADE